MLFVLTGSSCSGKTTIARDMAARLEPVAVHDHDEELVPERADLVWRQRTTEHWIRRALAYQADRVEMVLCGQSPLGEVLAAPSSVRLDGIAVCLVDVADDQRHARLIERDGDRWDATAVDAFDGWANWHRAHAANPQHRQT